MEDHMSHTQSEGISLGGLLRAAQADEDDDSPAMNQIIRRFRFLAKKLARTADAPVHMLDDLENAALLALVTAVRNHDSGRFGFASYARIYMGGAVLREYHRLLPPKGVTVTATPLEFAADPPQPEDEDVLDRLAPWGGERLAGVVAQLPRRQCRLLTRRYVDDEEVASIAADGGTSVSAVSQRLGTTHKRVAEGLAA
jgi:DNA-directed RNA polymerase specialized sigma subunit